MSERQFDILDIVDVRGSIIRHWKMTYADGRERTSQYRYDLIRDVDKTRITLAGALEWPDHPFDGYWNKIQSKETEE
jgi:hypothetical protein